MTLGDSPRVTRVSAGMGNSVGVLEKLCIARSRTDELVAFMNLVGNKRNQSIIIKFGEI